MLENPTQAQVSPPSAADSASVIKRYAPPNQRNRSLNRRKSGDRFDRNNNLYGNDVEKNQLATSRNTPVTDHGDTGSSNVLNDFSRPKSIPLQGFSRSEAAQLLRDRGRAVTSCYNDKSIDSSERPEMYSSGSWGPFRVPHQMISPANTIGTSSGAQTDFLAELFRKMQKANASFDNQH